MFLLSEVAGANSCGMDLTQREERLLLSETAGANSFGMDLTPREFCKLSSQNGCSYLRQLGPIPLGWTSLRERSEQFVMPKRLLFSEVVGANSLGMDLTQRERD